MRHDIKKINLADKVYPHLLQQIHRPPPVLYCQGNVDLLANNCLAVVGTRRASDYGCRVARMLAQELVDNRVTIVSGLAYGIDLAAQEVAMNNKAGTVAVMAGGLNKMRQGYKARIMDRVLATGGLLLSEMPPDLEPRANLFAVRNRLISGISAGVIVVEAPHKSGALITASLALESNRPVMVVPAGIFAERSTGCLELIKQGACLIRSGQDIYDEMNWEFDRVEVNMVKSSQAELYWLDLIGADGIGLEELVAKIPGKAQETIEQINRLVLKGKIWEIGEKLYCSETSAKKPSS